MGISEQMFAPIGQKKFKGGSGCSVTYHPVGLDNKLLSQGCILGKAPHSERIHGSYSPGTKGKQEALQTSPSSWQFSQSSHSLHGLLQQNKAQCLL